MDILKATERLKNSDEEPIKLLAELKNIYEKAKERNSQLCSKCEEWIKLDLPLGCICKPDYCVRNSEDLILIIWYEELRSTTTNKKYT